MSSRKDFVFAKETRSPQQLSQLNQMENRDDSNQVVRKETSVPSLQKENSEQRRINRHETKMFSKMISPGDSSLFRKLPSSGRSPDPPPATSSPFSPNLGYMVTGFFLPVQLFFLPTTKKVQSDFSLCTSSADDNMILVSDSHRQIPLNP